VEKLLAKALSSSLRTDTGKVEVRVAGHRPASAVEVVIGWDRKEGPFRSFQSDEFDGEKGGQHGFYSIST